MPTIQDKVVALTGASSGIGEATAHFLAEKGARLVLGARRADRLAAVVDGITAKGGTATGVIVDVTRREDLRRLTDTAVERYGRLDVLVSNAGIMAVSPFDDLRQDDWDAMVATHITPACSTASGRPCPSSGGRDRATSSPSAPPRPTSSSPRRPSTPPPRRR